MRDEQFDLSKNRLKALLSHDAQEMERFLIACHNAEPGLSEECLGIFKTVEGLNSYGILAKAVSSTDLNSIVDLACGNGALSDMLVNLIGADAKQVIAIDLSEEELKLAKKRLQNHKNVRFVCAPAINMPLPDASVDAVLCHMAFMLFSPIEPTVAEIARILRPGGIFSAILPEPSVGVFDQARVDLIECLKLENWNIDLITWGEEKARNIAGLRDLFCAPLFQGTEFQSYSLSAAGQPENLVEILLESFYYSRLLSVESVEKLRNKWQDMLRREPVLTKGLRRISTRRASI